MFATTNLYFLMIILIPLLGLLINLFLFKKNTEIGSIVATFGIWIGFINALIAWIAGLPFFEKYEIWGFIANEISWLMATLVLFVSGIVHQFSLRYMSGDRNYRRYFLLLGLATISTLLVVAADNVIILIFFWMLSNLTLAFLMTHKSQWIAAKNSGILAIRIFILGLSFLIAGAGLLAYDSGTMSLNQIVKLGESLSPSIRIMALLLIALTAFMQSGIWPFHGWLISSLNSPTPVSALMHAGLVNGGGLLIVRFSQIYLHETLVLNFLFVSAAITLILGGIWKLLQSDIKRMLACSTMTQMGFMMMQCSLGFFSAAIAHLCWHGLFKAFLFLRSGSTIQEIQKKEEKRGLNYVVFFLSSLCGLIGTAGYIYGSIHLFTHHNTTLILAFFCWLASTQLAHTLLEIKHSPIFLFIGAVVCIATGYIYGFTVNLIEIGLHPLTTWQPQPLNIIHIAVMTFIFCIWMALSFKSFIDLDKFFWWRRFYVNMLNASQPNKNTITSIRNGYKF